MLKIICIISKLVLVIAVVTLTSAQSNSIIETIPFLPNNIIASGYTGLILKSQFELRSEFSVCSWITETKRIIPIFTTFVSCQNRTDRNFNVTCISTNNTIYTILIVGVSIDETNSHQNYTSFSIICYENIIIAGPLIIEIQDCPPLSPPVLLQSISQKFNSLGKLACTNHEARLYLNGTQLQNTTTTCNATGQWSNTDGLECLEDCIPLALPILVHSKSQIFSSQGKLACSNNGTLFYSNGTQLQDTTTMCSATGQWSNIDGLECWKAPNVSLSGDLVVLEGARASFTCDYNDTLPEGTQSAFYIDEFVVILRKGEVFTTILSKRNHNELIYCQAITPFTEVIDTEGISDGYLLNVWFRPYQNSTKRCVWELEKKGSCDVILYSNPPSSLKSLMKNGLEILHDNITFSIEGPKQIMTIATEKVGLNDSGCYTLILYSSMFSLNFNIQFEIYVTEIHATETHVTATHVTETDATETDVTETDFTETDVTEKQENSSFIGEIAIYASCVIVGIILLTSVFILIFRNEKGNHHRCCNKLNNTTERQFTDAGLYENHQFSGNGNEGIYLNEIVKQTQKAYYENFNIEGSTTFSQSSERYNENNFLQEQCTSSYITMKPCVNH